MKIFGLTLALIVLPGLPSYAAEGMISIKSFHGVSETADRFERVLGEKGMTLFNRVRHSESAREVGFDLRDTELILFGNPRVGSPLMACAQTSAIDLPQKVLFWKDVEGTVWISYNDPRYLEKRHTILGCEETLMKIEKALAGMADAAAKPEAATVPPAGFRVP